MLVPTERMEQEASVGTVMRILHVLTELHRDTMCSGCAVLQRPSRFVHTYTWQQCLCTTCSPASAPSRPTTSGTTARR